MPDGRIFTGIAGDGLILRLGGAGTEAELRRERVREVKLTGR